MRSKHGTSLKQSTDEGSSTLNWEKKIDGFFEVKLKLESSLLAARWKVLSGSANEYAFGPSCSYEFVTDCENVSQFGSPALHVFASLARSLTIALTVITELVVGTSGVEK